MFPKQNENAKTSLVVKGLKTDKSERTAYLTGQFIDEIKKPLKCIEKDKAYYRDKYHVAAGSTAATTAMQILLSGTQGTQGSNISNC